jgi:hypothetical protein
MEALAERVLKQRRGSAGRAGAGGGGGGAGAAREGRW